MHCRTYFDRRNQSNSPQTDSLEEVSKHVQTIIKEVGIPKLTQLLFVADEQEKHDQIGAIIQACGIPIHAKATKVSTSKAKYTKIALDQQMKQSRQIDVSQYKLMPGFFTRTNGEPLPIQATFSPCISGVRMMPSANAEQWLLHKGKIIPEEMALFLIGDLTEQQQIKTQKVVAPAYNTSGDQVLLAGWLLQLGEAEVKLSTHDDPRFRRWMFKYAVSHCGPMTLQKTNGMKLSEVQ